MKDADRDFLTAVIIVSFFAAVIFIIHNTISFTPKMIPV